MTTNLITSIDTILSHPGLAYSPETKQYLVKEGYELSVTACNMIPNDMGDCEEYKLDCTLPENSSFFCRDNHCNQIVSGNKPTIKNKTFMGMGSNGNRDMKRSWEVPFPNGQRVYTVNRRD